ncbi:MAG: cell division protein FtsQ/DivIB [Candidatus Omnitrophota bacterium]
MGRILKKLEKVKNSFQPEYLGVGAVLLLALIFILYSGSLMYRSGFFRVREVHSNVAIEPVLKNYILNKSLFKLDIGKIYAFLSRRHPEYKKIQILKEFPSALKINIIQRKPFAQLFLKGFYILDREGVVISANEFNSAQQLTVIEMGKDNVTLSKGVCITDKRLELAYELIEVIKTKKFLGKFSIKTINVAFPESTYFVANDTRIIIGSTDFERKLYILENLLNEKLSGNIASVEYIDLRYKKAYVGYKR